MRKDLGYNEIENPEVKQAEADQQSDTSSDGLVTNNRDLNDLIKNAMTKRDEK